VRLHLHGLVVETRCEAGEDPGALLLGLLPRAPEAGAAGLLLETALAGSAAELRIEGPVAFRLREVELRVDPEGAVVTSPGAAIRISWARHPLPGPDRISVRLLAPLAGDAAWAFAQVPLLIALLAALRPRGLHHLHAAALSAPDGRSLLVAGDAGCGKSTLAAALVLAGCGYLGDDVVLLARPPRLLSLPRAFHLSDRSAALVPGAAAAEARRTLAGKRAVDPRALFPGRELREAPAPSALVFPRVVDRPDTVLRPMARVEALGRLVESSALAAVGALPGVREHLALLGEVADGAPAFQAELGRDLLLHAAHTGGRLLGEALA
jgi:hypothetical protein